MPEKLVRQGPRSANRRVSNGSGESSGRRSRAAREEDATERVEELASGGNEGEDFDEAGDRGKRTLRSELGDVVRDAALEVLGPVAKKATTRAAKYAITRGPSLARESVGPRLKESVGPALKEAGGPGALVKGALSNVSGAGGGLLSKVGIGKDSGGKGGPPGTGRGRRLPVQESIDIAVPVETAYNQFTQFEDFAKFMFRAEQVRQVDDTHLEWQEKIWGIRRKWEVEITDQQPNERIAWKSESGVETTGVITFHSLDDKLTRVMVTNDFQPHGLLEKTASGFRMSRRALRSDLMRLKAFIEMRDQETGAWRGEVEEGEVKDEEPQDGKRRRRRRRRDEDESRGSARGVEEEVDEEYEDEEPEYEDEEGRYDEEPEGSEEDEPEEEEEEEPEREPARRKQAVRSRRPARPRR